jgi:membrane dipeptidase
VILSHSDVRHYNNLSRNVPDAVLDKIGKGHGRVDGVVMVNFYPTFASPDGKANVSTIADHAEYIGERIGRSQCVSSQDFACVGDLAVFWKV